MALTSRVLLIPRLVQKPRERRQKHKTGTDSLVSVQPLMYNKVLLEVSLSHLLCAGWKRCPCAVCFRLAGRGVPVLSALGWLEEVTVASAVGR